MAKTNLMLILIFAIFIAGCNQANLQEAVLESQQPFNGSYKIGVMLALSGDAATYGLPEQAVIKIAADEVTVFGRLSPKKTVH